MDIEHNTSKLIYYKDNSLYLSEENLNKFNLVDINYFLNVEDIKYNNFIIDSIYNHFGIKVQLDKILNTFRILNKYYFFNELCYITSLSLQSLYSLFSIGLEDYMYNVQIFRPLIIPVSYSVDKGDYKLKTYKSYYYFLFNKNKGYSNVNKYSYVDEKFSIFYNKKG